MADQERKKTGGLLNLLGRPVVTKEGDDSSDEKTDEVIQIPSHLPILPLRGMVVFPMTLVPIRVGQARSVRLIDDAVVGRRLIGLVASRDPKVEAPGANDVYRIGTIAAVHRLFKAPDGTITLIVQGLLRIRVGEFVSESPYLAARVSAIPERIETSLEVEALQRSIAEIFRRLSELVPAVSEEMSTVIANMDNPLQLVYAVANLVKIDLKEAQRLLELGSVAEKLHLLLTLLTKELEVLELSHKVRSEAQSEMQKTQRDYFLREQMKAIKKELGEADEQQIEVEEFRKKIEELEMPEEAEKEARRELDRLSKMPTIAAEYSIIRTYLDWLTSLPWNAQTEDNLDIAHARQVLDVDHYNLAKVKERTTSSGTSARG
jgi:ATP-dependent Lon protease